MTNSTKKPPSRTPEQKERHLINLAIDLVEKHLLDGTATSQEIVHFLKLATTREKLEQERLRSEVKLAEAKSKQIEMGEKVAELYENAVKAMSLYSGKHFEDDEYEYDE